jgi:ABC-2 type transport system ATP-binding protein
MDLSAPTIRTVELAKRYGSIAALSGLTMTVGRGEVFGFLGPNGAGKTTAVKLLLGLTRATGGEAWVLGSPAGDRQTRRRIGYLPELFRYQDWMTAREVMMLHARLMGMPTARRSGEIQEALTTVGLADRQRGRVGTFSKGMQQRLGLAVALLGRPDLLFLDEPTSALDPVGRHDVREIIRGLKGHGTTVFLNSHLLTEVEQVCDRVAVLDHGRVIAQGSIDALRGESRRVRLQLGGSPERAEEIAARFGAVKHAGDWLEIDEVDTDTVPDLVAALVAAGVRVFAVEPSRQSLEDRFLQLLGGERDGSADDRPPHLA